MTMTNQDFEKLGHLLSRQELRPGAAQGRLGAGPLRVEATDHACRLRGDDRQRQDGLCLSLLEEAAIDGIPVIAIDPKGDLGNLLLTFPELRGEDFLPWVDPDEAARKGLSREQFAEQTAELWREGLADLGAGRRADPAASRRRRPGDLHAGQQRRAAADGASVVRRAAAGSDRPDRGLSRASRLGGLGPAGPHGFEADPITSREHILLANVLDHAWRAGRDLDMAGLIHAVQSPPFDKVGVIDLETFYPAKERFALAMKLNNLLASPGFAAWMEGEPLDVGSLLYTREGKPRVSILSIAHLSDSERMFFVTILLNEVLAWVRTQPGTSSLRAVLYMDEIFGYFPPSANPPSKTPMLTLLKQARAFGLGIVLATQNPVDLDYKGLSNAGTWFLGRLQTERDKERVLDGLEGASTAAGHAFDRPEDGRAPLGPGQPGLPDEQRARGPAGRLPVAVGAVVSSRSADPRADPDADGTEKAGPGESDPGAGAGLRRRCRRFRRNRRPPPRSTSSPSARSSTAGSRPVVPPDVPEFFLPRRGPLDRGRAPLSSRAPGCGQAPLRREEGGR